MMDEMEKHWESLEAKMKGLGIRVDEVEQKTIWKISDCEQLLKKRVNEQYIKNSIETAEEWLENLMQKLDDKGIERLEKVFMEL